MALKRALGLFELTMLGVGLIVGAGIYVLVGIAGVQAGPALWLSFVLAGVIAVLTALTYAELASAYPKAGSSYYFAKHAFKKKWLSFLAGWLVSASMIISAAAVALGFAQYAASFGIPLTPAVTALLLIAALLILNVYGVKIAADANVVGSLLEVGGLVLVICIGLVFTSPTISFEMPNGFTGLISGAAIAFFAFIGFEVIATEAEEVKNPGKTIPRAVMLAIGICTVLYVLAALAFTNLLSYEEIIKSTDGATGPLAYAASKVGGDLILKIIAVIALFSTANTVLISLIGASRMIYGMASDKALPSLLAKTNKHASPQNALILSAILAGAYALTGDLPLVAETTVIGMLAVFSLDNIALIRLRFTEPHAHRPFKVPFNLGKIPVPTAIALVAAVLLALHELALKPELGLAFVGILGVGLLVYEAEERTSLIKG